MLGAHATSADTVTCQANGQVSRSEDILCTARELSSSPAHKVEQLRPGTQADDSPDRPAYIAATLQDTGKAGQRMGLSDQDVDPATLPLVNPQLSLHERDVISEPLLTGVKVTSIYAAGCNGSAQLSQCPRNVCCGGSGRSDSNGKGPVHTADRATRVRQDHLGAGCCAGSTNL